MKAFIQSKLGITPERYDLAMEQLRKASDFLGLPPLASKIQAYVAPYFSADTMIGRIWIVARDRLGTPLLDNQILVVSVLGMAALAYAYYRAHAQTPAPPPESAENSSAAGSNDLQQNGPSPAPSDVSSDDSWEQVNTGQGVGGPGPSSLRTSSITPSGVDLAQVQERLGDPTASNVSFLLAHYGTINAHDQELGDKILRFMDEYAASTDRRASRDFMAKCSPAMEMQIDAMVNAFAEAAIREEYKEYPAHMAKNIADNKQFYLKTYMALYRENAILALETEANLDASKAFFESQLADKFTLKKMAPDGDCFFHAIGYHLHKDQSEIRKDLLAAKQAERAVSDAEQQLILKSAKDGGDQGVATDANYLAYHYQCCIWVHSHLVPQESVVGRQFASQRTIHLFYNGLNHWDTLEEIK